MHIRGRRTHIFRIQRTLIELLPRFRYSSRPQPHQRSLTESDSHQCRGTPQKTTSPGFTFAVTFLLHRFAVIKPRLDASSDRTIEKSLQSM